MEIKEQLIDSGAVIGYRPNLKYEKFNKPVEQTEPININQYINKASYSTTLKSFLNNLPNAVLENLNENIDIINEMIDRLCKEFDNETHDTYSNINSFVNALRAKNNEYAKEFLNAHKANIGKSQIPEIIELLENEKERINIISDTLKILYYGTSNITNEECKQKDAEMTAVLVEKEKQGKGINYLALSVDSVLNKSINTYSVKIDEACTKLEQVAYLRDENGVNNPILTPMIQRLFLEVDDEINARSNSYDMQQSIDTTRKALYNYYIKRKDLNEFYNTVSETSREGSYLLSKISFFEKETDNSIENINKTLMGNSFFVNSMEKLMAEKQQLRKVYATISYT